jgi:LPXTG-site transpeptidase (sortase) family protein
MAKKVIGIVLMMIGIILIAYPKLVKMGVNANISTNITDLTATDGEANLEADYSEFWENVEAYNESLNDETYEALPDTLGYITIPKLNITYPIGKGTDEDTLNNGVGHVFGTPIFGIIAGHSGIYGKEFFTHLDRLEIGDEVKITMGGKDFILTVSEIETVLPSEVTNTEGTLTLMTCTPYGVNSHRLLVRCILGKD